jgi:hypothetical protein
LREPDLAIDVALYPVEDFVVERVLELITHRLLRSVAIRIVSSFYAHFGALTSIADVRWWLRDRLEILEQLYAVAAVTAILTIALNLALRAFGLTVPDWAGPATGFVVAVPVSAIGYWSSRDRHRQQLRDAVQAAVNLLDWDLAVGWDAGRSSHRPLTIRDLARAARTDQLQDVLDAGVTGGYPLSRRIDEFVGDFERRTAHSAGLLVPPRANTLVAQTIREMRQAGYAAAASLESGAGNLTEFTARLLRGVDAAEELELTYDRKAARHAAAERDAAATKRAARRVELQGIAAAAAHDVETNATPPDRLSNLRRMATLRDVAAADTFAFAASDEANAIPEWRQRISRARDAFQAAVLGTGYDMDPRTHRSWIAVTDELRELDNALTELGSLLETRTRADDRERSTLDARIMERHDALPTFVRRLLERIDELRALAVQ